MGSDSNNSVGKNERAPKAKHNINDVYFADAGTDTDAGLTGFLLTAALLKDELVAKGAAYEDGSLFAVTDKLLEVEVDVYHIDTDVNVNGALETTTTATAFYTNNGGTTTIVGGGSSQDGNDGVTGEESKFESVFVQNGTAITYHVTFEKA